MATESEDLTATRAPARSLRRQIGRGAAWAAASNIVMRLASIGVTALLARVLSKEDFGAFAIALAVFLVVSSLAELGMGSAIARSAMEPDDIAPTVATISIAISAVLAGAMALSAGALSSVLGQPGAAEPIRVLALCMALTGVFAVPGAQLVREFRQDRIFLATAVGFVVANPLLVVMAVNGGDATSFAWSRVVGQLVPGLAFVAACSRHYWPGWRRAAVGPLLRFGIPLSLANLVNWTLLNADYLIIGNLLTAAEVGVYMIAFNVANWSIAVLGSVLNGVVVPAFGRLSHQRDLLAEAMVAATRLVGIIAFPICALTVALADPLVETLFGRRWAEAAPVLTILALYGCLYAFSLLFVNVLVATGATVRLLVIQIAWVAVLVPSMVLGLEVAGLPGAAWAHVITIGLVAIPAYLVAVQGTTGRQGQAVARAVVRPALGAAAAGVAAWAVAGVMQPPWLGLVAGGLAGALVYLAVEGRQLLLVLSRGSGRDRLLSTPELQEVSS